MKKFFSAVLIAVMLVPVWAGDSFAARQIVNPGGTVDVNGQNEGVDMQGGAGTLIVGVGFPNIGAVGGPSVTTTAANTDDIDFNNLVTSTVSGDVGTVGLFFLDVTAIGNATVNFQGTVFTTTGNLGTGTVSLNSGTGTNIGAWNFTGDGTVSLAANTTNTGALTTTAGAQTGTLSLASASQWTGAVGGAIGLRSINVVGGTNTAGVTAGITGAVDVFGASLLTNRLNITGALTTHAASVINTTLASTSIYGRIVPTGASTLVNGITVNALVPSTAVLLVGNEFDIIQATSGTTGVTPLTTIQNPTNPLYTFTGVSSTNGILRIRLTGTPMGSVSSPAVQSLQNTPQTADILVVEAAINALTTTDAVNNAAAQLDPTNNGAATQGTFNPVNTAINAITTHLGEYGNYNPDSSSHPDESGRSGVRDRRDVDRSKSSIGDRTNIRSGVSTGDFWTDNGIWVKGFGDDTTQDAHKGVNGYDSNMWGAIGGIDGILRDNVLLGIAGGYAATNVDNKGEGGGTDIDSYIGTIYASFDDASPWYADAGLAFTWQDYDSARRIVFPGIDRTATSDPDGQTYTAFGDIGYVIPIDPQWNITPMAGLTYNHTNIDSYTEDGAGDLSLNVDNQEYDQLLGSLGARVDTTIHADYGKWVPEVHARWLYDFIGDQVATTSTFAPGGASFDTNGLDPEQSTYNLGTGITFYSKGNLNITGMYDYRFGTDFASHTGTGTVRWTF